MKNKGDLSTWSYRELKAKERTLGQYDVRATEIRAEIARRQTTHKAWAMWIGVGAAVIAAIAAVAAYFSK